MDISAVLYIVVVLYVFFFFFQAEDGIRDLVRSRGLGDVYKRQVGAAFCPARRDAGVSLGLRPDALEATFDNEAQGLSLIHI